MKKLKLILIGLSLIVCSNFAFAMDEIEELSQNLQNYYENPNNAVDDLLNSINKKEEEESEKTIYLEENEKYIEEIINRIDFKKTIKDNLKKLGYLNKEDMFEQCDYNDINNVKKLSYDLFVKETKIKLKNKIKDVIEKYKDNKFIINYSKIEIELPENCICHTYKKNSILTYVEPYGKITLKKSGHFKKLENKYNL